MSKLKLTYFDFPGSRGEECRLALHASGVDFEDDRIAGKDWAAMKDSTPFGALPVLTVEGKGKLAESIAILTYIGRSYGLHPTDLWQAAHHEAIMCAAEALRHEGSATGSIKDEDEKKAARQALASGAIARFGKSMEAQIPDGPFVGGANLSVADIKVYMVARGFIRGVYDHIPKDVFSPYPRLLALVAAVEAHPKVAEWMSKHAG